MASMMRVDQRPEAVTMKQWSMSKLKRNVPSTLLLNRLAAACQGAEHAGLPYHTKALRGGGLSVAIFPPKS